MPKPISLSNSTSIIENYEPFYNKDYKCLRVAGEVLLGIIASLFYKIVSLGCWVICADQKEREYSALARYHCNYGFNKIGAYWAFGDKIIDFSFNSPKSIPPLSQAEKKQFANWVRQAATPEVPIDLEIPDHFPNGYGCCLGMSLDFIYHYVNSSQVNPLDKIKECTSKHAEGATIESQMMQMISFQQNKDSIWETRKQKIDHFRKQIFEELDREADGLASTPNQPDLTIQIEALVNRTDEQFFNLECQSLQIQIEYEKQWIQPVAKLRGLHLSNEYICKDEDISQADAPPEFREAFLELDKGPYLVVVRGTRTQDDDKERFAHAMTYINTGEDQHFLFDPNKATIMSNKEDLFSTFWELLKDSYFYNEEGKCSILLFRCT